MPDSALLDLPETPGNADRFGVLLDFPQLADDAVSVAGHRIGPTVSELEIPQLAAGGFAAIGLAEMAPNRRTERPAIPRSLLVASLQGRGRVRIGDDFVEWPAQRVLLLPRGSCPVFEASGFVPWTLAWAACRDTTGTPAIAGHQPRLGEGDGSTCAQVLTLLLRESSGERDGPTLQTLVALLHTHVQRLVGQPATDPRLARLWEAVAANLAHPWDIVRLARHAHLSAEQLRRLCHRHHRRSPMAHVRDLRMRHASALLRASDCGVEEVAYRAGFASLYSFSAAFKRWSGVSPAHYRVRGTSTEKPHR